ncbi:MAG: DUF481 domain-containing protein [Polyangiaceae bacterium]
MRFHGACLGWLWGAALVAAAASARAQVNVERLRADLQQRPYFANVLTSFTGRVGNVNSVVTGGGIFAGALIDRHLGFFRAEGNYEAYSWVPKVSKSFAHARYNYTLLPSIAGELFAQVQQNKFERLRLRTLYGIGPRFTMFRSEEVDVYAGTGYMLEYEEIDVAPGATDAPTTWAHRSTNYVAVAVRIEESLRLTSATYFQPRFDVPSDFRVLSETSISASFGKRLFAKVSAILRYDSAPPSNVRSADAEVQNSFGANF